jgi:hypothetical protein
MAPKVTAFPLTSGADTGSEQHVGPGADPGNFRRVSGHPRSAQPLGDGGKGRDVDAVAGGLANQRERVGTVAQPSQCP